MVLLALGAGVALADGRAALPAGTEPMDGIPAFHPPPGDAATLEAWCDEAVRLAELAEDEDHAAHLLYAAAWTRERALRDPGGAARLYAAAGRTAGPSALLGAVAWLDAGRVHLAEGGLGAARASVDAAHAATAPRTLGPDPTPREAALWRRLTVILPRTEADLLEREGHPAEAARTLEALGGARGDPGRLAEAARLHARAGESEEARARIEEAIAAATSESDLVAWTFWRLHLERGLLDETGQVALVDAGLDAHYLEDVQVALRGLAGNPHVGPQILGLASQAVLSGQLEAALALYDMALGDRVLQERARREQSVARGLLAAVAVALDLSRPDDASRILDALARTTQIPPSEVAAWQRVIDAARIALARAAEGDEAVAGDVAAEEERPPGERSRSVDAGRLRPPPAPESHERREPPAREAPEDGSGIGRLAGGLALALLLALLLLRTRRGRRA